MPASSLVARRTATALLIALLAGSFFANADPLQTIQHSGTNTFVTGGIGLDESPAFNCAMKDWPLTLQLVE